MSAIEAEQPRKVFPGGVEAVAGISLAVDEGEVFGFLGPNGAGKTTTIRMLTTLLRPTSGVARVWGLDVTTDGTAIRRLIGAALQEAGLDHMATGRELLALQARLHGVRGLEPERRAGRMLELVGLAEAADRLIKTYSGGMKRRLDLASALIHEPRVLFLDEPTAGLDHASRRAVWDEVRRLARDAGVTVFLTTQYLEEADRLAERIAIIDHGRTLAGGTPAELNASVGSDVDHRGHERERRPQHGHRHRERVLRQAPPHAGDPGRPDRGHGGGPGSNLRPGPPGGRGGPGQRPGLRHRADRRGGHGGHRLGVGPGLLGDRVRHRSSDRELPGHAEHLGAVRAVLLPHHVLRPEGALSGWLATAARYNPMTYLLRGLRALSMSGWDAGEIGVALLAVAGTGAVTLTFALRAMLRRVR